LLDGLKPKDIAPKIFEVSSIKNWTVSEALHMDAWTNKVNLHETISMVHLSQFVDLWTHISHVHLQLEVEDDIIWKFTNNGQYTTASAYEMQFLGLVHSRMEKNYLEGLGPPKD
jgi:hypothetical protein